jgi:hypothetical protein
MYDGEGWAKKVLNPKCGPRPESKKTYANSKENRRDGSMDLDRVKVTPRDQQVLDLRVLSSSNKAAAIRLQQ